MIDDDALRARRRRHIGRALARARWIFEAAFEDRIRERGFEDFRPSDVGILARLPSEGARITELAARGRSTKQAVGKLVQGLAERDYVSRRVDPADARARVVVLTSRGRALLEAAMEEIAAIEGEWEEAVGAETLEAVRDGLLALADRLEGPDYL